MVQKGKERNLEMIKLVLLRLLALAILSTVMQLGHDFGSYIFKKFKERRDKKL